MSTTRYEIAAYLPDGSRVNLGYTARVTCSVLLDAARSAADSILPHIGDDDSVSYSRDRGLTLGAVVVRRTGRTERDVLADANGW